MDVSRASLSLCLAAGLGVDSRNAASISASAIHSAVRSTSRSFRPQMSFKIMYGSMP